MEGSLSGVEVDNLAVVVYDLSMELQSVGSRYAIQLILERHPETDVHTSRWNLGIRFMTINNSSKDTAG